MQLSCAQPSLGQLRKPSSFPPAWLSPSHECQQMRSQKGDTMPAPTIDWKELSVCATARQISRCDSPSSPPLQMASTRGRTSRRT